MLKRYLLFKFNTYYPQGGFNDFICDSDDIDDIKRKMLATMDVPKEQLKYHYCRFQVVDVQKRRFAKFHRFPDDMDYEFVEKLDFGKLRWKKLKDSHNGDDNSVVEIKNQELLTEKTAIEMTLGAMLHEDISICKEDEPNMLMSETISKNAPLMMDLVDSGLVHKISGGIPASIIRCFAIGKSYELPIPFVYQDTALEDIEENATLVASTIDRMILHGHKGFFGKHIYGYLTHPNRVVVDGNKDMTLSDKIDSLLKKAGDKLIFGPFALYLSESYREEACDLKLPKAIQIMRHVDLIPDGEMVLVHLVSDTVDIAVSLDAVLVERSDAEQAENNYRIVTALVPRLKARQDDVLGVLHYRNGDKPC